MVTAVLILGVFALLSVLLPVLSRRRLRPRGDVWGDWMRRHGLSAGEAGDISNGITRGVRYEEPRLRAPAADHAEGILRTGYSDPMVALTVGLYLVPVVLDIVLRPHGPIWLLVAMWAAFSAVMVRRRHGVRRSLELNRGAEVPE